MCESAVQIGMRWSRRIGVGENPNKRYSSCVQRNPRRNQMEKERKTYLMTVDEEEEKIKNLLFEKIFFFTSFRYRRLCVWTGKSRNKNSMKEKFPISKNAVEFIFRLLEMNINSLSNFCPRFSHFPRSRAQKTSSSSPGCYSIYANRSSWQ